MAKIVRWEFLGNWRLFWFYCVTVLGLPIAVLYLINATIRIEEDVPDAERLLETLRHR